MPLDIICNLNQCKTDLSGEKKKIKENNNDQINTCNKHTAVINIVGKQNVTFNLTFLSTYNFRRNFLAATFAFLYACSLSGFLAILILTDSLM